LVIKLDIEQKTRKKETNILKAKTQCKETDEGKSQGPCADERQAASCGGSYETRNSCVKRISRKDKTFKRQKAQNVGEKARCGSKFKTQPE